MRHSINDLRRLPPAENPRVVTKVVTRPISCCRVLLAVASRFKDCQDDGVGAHLGLHQPQMEEPAKCGRTRKCVLLFLPPINRLTAKSAEDDAQLWRVTAPQQRLYFLPLPQGHGALRAGLGVCVGCPFRLIAPWNNR